MKNFDIYADVTNRIIEQLEQGIIPWQRPWTGVIDGPVKHKTGKPYSILNQMLLGKPGEYLSFLECKQAGGSVKKGAKSRTVVFYKAYGHVQQDENGNVVLDDEGNIKVKVVPLLRYSNVFHIDDCEGIAPKWDKPTEPRELPLDQEAESILADYSKRCGVRIEHAKQNEAYYNPLLDMISLPKREQFPQMAEYYGTAFHEATHSTGHKSRLNRINLLDNHFGSKAYANEELVAEIGSAAILHSIGIETSSSSRNNAAYIQNWLTALHNDKRLIVSAASKADKAVRLILNLADESAREQEVA